MPFQTKIQSQFPNAKIFINEPLKNHSSFKIGGPASVMIVPENEKELINVLKFCKNEEINFFILGKGSNVLFSDNGFDGVVIKISDGFNKMSFDGDFAFCESGTSLANFTMNCAKNGLSGLEFASGIPGTLGGAIFMNAGAYEHSISECLHEVRYLDSDYNVAILNKDQCNMGYRSSIFSKNNYVILSASFKLDNEKPEIIKQRIKDFNDQRKSKQPINYPSAGSVFKRPQNSFAGMLIEQAGLKGKSIGGAEVSQKHAGFIINKGDATAKDVIELIDLIKDKVYNDFLISLELEIKLIGL